MKRLGMIISAAWLFAASVFAQTAGTAKSKNLIVYFTLYGNQKTVQTDADSSASRTTYNGKVRGNTEVIAQMIQELAGGDMVSLKMKNAYPDSYDDVVSMERIEQRNQTHVPVTTKTDVSGYQNIFIGFPTWWYDVPMAVNSWLDSVDLTGKNVYVFCTSGGSGLLRTISTIQKQEPNAKVSKTGFAVYYTDVTGAKKDVQSWLLKNGIIKS